MPSTAVTEFLQLGTGIAVLFRGNISMLDSFPNAPFLFSLQGPVIKAEVGDTVLVTFANKADKNYSIMAHGVSYNKLSEGVAYLDGKFLAVTLTRIKDCTFASRFTCSSYILK